MWLAHVVILCTSIPAEIMASGPRLPFAVPDEHMAGGNGQTILLIIFALCPSCVRHMQRSNILTLERASQILDSIN